MTYGKIMVTHIMDDDPLYVKMVSWNHRSRAHPSEMSSVSPRNPWLSLLDADEEQRGQLWQVKDQSVSRWCVGKHIYQYRLRICGEVLLSWHSISYI